MQDEGTTVPRVEVRCGIPRQRAYRLLKEFNYSNGSVLPGLAQKAKNRCTKQKLFPQHTHFLIQYLVHHRSSTMEITKDTLLEQFPDTDNISIPSLWKHVTIECTFSLKMASLYNEERDVERTLRLRYEVVSKWKEIGVDFQKNCVFVDEAGFNTHMIRGRAWSKVGEPANVTVYKQRGANISIVGYIAYFGTVNFSNVEPSIKGDAKKLEQEYANPVSKKRKPKDPEKKKPLNKGTTAYHIVKFMQTVMDTLDNHDKKGLFIVMNNCRIHHSAFVVDAFNKRGFKTLFMPPYSPFLNPIEECWSKIKSNIKRNPLDEANTLTSRFPAACGSVTVKDCQGRLNMLKPSGISALIKNSA
ncbi:hypothetical protein [Parasitella parasitica]|uniref:Tc1-like transposase DDE domain-containing protein n=1 Tax=Parasitella parasitica TaxID=35722 RepID=A0A0B7NNI5_9FUNG|nr:hypothetical protein [Parasitella parasitica]